MRPEVATAISTKTLDQPEGHVEASDPKVVITSPERYRVIRRNGKVTGFDREKIKVAVTKAFLAVEGGHAAASSRIHEMVEKITEKVFLRAFTQPPSGWNVPHRRYPGPG